MRRGRRNITEQLPQVWKHHPPPSRGRKTRPASAANPRHQLNSFQPLSSPLAQATSSAFSLSPVWFHLALWGGWGLEKSEWGWEQAGLREHRKGG